MSFVAISFLCRTPDAVLFGTAKIWKQLKCHQVWNEYTKFGTCTSWDRVLVRVSIAAKRHHDHGNSHKGKHLIEAAAYSLENQTFIIMAGSMAAHRQT